MLSVNWGLGMLKAKIEMACKNKPCWKSLVDCGVDRWLMYNKVTLGEEDVAQRQLHLVF